MSGKTEKSGSNDKYLRADDLSEAKRIMERLVKTPPKPRKKSGQGDGDNHMGAKPRKARKGRLR